MASSQVAAENVTAAIPSRSCDLVMKGGITSGVVYPLAICELATAFRFRNIGGASAGAIAAAAAAAAELGRYRSSVEGYRRLAELPTFLGATTKGAKRTRLFYLFQPQRQTRRVFNTCVAALGGGAQAVVRLILAAVSNFWLAAVFGALPGIVFLWVGRRGPGARLPLEMIAVATTIAGVLVATAVAFALGAVKALSGNGFGLVSGMPGVGGRNLDALTLWLTKFLNELAGLDPEGAPLTFGALWNAEPSSSPTINLEMMTTCLTHGRPYRLPFRDDENVKENRQFFWRRDEFTHLFPKQVIAWMADHRRPSTPDHAVQEAKFADAGFLPLPEPADLPVVVAVRLSLSFPILLSAVPLHAVDYSRTDPANQQPERCWFSDGGISSNFPVHFFDSALPRWPTFAIDLEDKHPDHDAGPYMPATNRAGTLVKWNRFEAEHGVRRLVGFLGTIVMTAKDWADNAQCRLPGFRDRIAQIHLSRLDGGLNLDMSPEQITRLASYGQQAGRDFVKRFALNDPACVLTWNNHRRVRLRSALAAIEEWLLRVERGASAPQGDDPPYGELIEDSAPPSYPWTNRQQQATAAKLFEELRIAAHDLTASTKPLAEESPRPRPELRIRSRV